MSVKPKMGNTNWRSISYKVYMGYVLIENGKCDIEIQTRTKMANNAKSKLSKVSRNMKIS